MAEFLTALSNAGNFTRDDFALVYRAKNKDATESSCRFVLQKLLDSGSIACGKSEIISSEWRVFYWNVQQMQSSLPVSADGLPDVQGHRAAGRS